MIKNSGWSNVLFVCDSARASLVISQSGSVIQRRKRQQVTSPRGGLHASLHSEGASAAAFCPMGNLSRWTRAPRPGLAHHALRSTRFDKFRPGGARELRQSPVSESHAPHALQARGSVCGGVGGVGRERRRDLRSARRQDGRGQVIKWRGASVEGDSSRGFAPLGSDRGGV